MQNNTLLLVLIALLTTAITTAQKVEFNKVSIEEVEAASDPIFPDDDAVVLYRGVKSTIGDYVQVHERFKIYNEEGFDYATVRIPYPDVFTVKGATYNLENGQVVKTKLDKDLVFEDEEIEGTTYKKFTFPKVKAGSVLELLYESKKGTFADIELQYDIPIKRLKVEVYNYTPNQFRIQQNSLAYLPVNRTESNSVSTITAQNIPALIRESYVYSMELYRAKLTFEWVGVENTIQLNTWENIAKNLMDAESFSKPLNPRGFYEEDLDAAIGGETDKKKQVEKIYDHLRNKIEWNEYNGFFPSNTGRDTYKKEKGNAAEINMLLVSMLRSKGFVSYPVLCSTKGNGIPVTPNIEAFNYIIASVVVNGKILLLDAAHTAANFTMLPQMLLNWQGMILKEEGDFEWIGMTDANLSVKSVMATAQLDEDLIFSGDVKERNSGYYALNIAAYTKDQSDMLKDRVIGFAGDGFQVYDIEVAPNPKTSNMNTVSYTYEQENMVDEIEDKLYISPMLFMGMIENPFKKEDRLYPIDFNFPQRNQYLLTIAIPEGYKVESVPDPINLALPDGMGNFTFNVSADDSAIKVSTRFQINQYMMGPGSYYDLREFYKQKITKETEKAVLVKM